MDTDAQQAAQPAEPDFKELVTKLRETGMSDNDIRAALEEKGLDPQTIGGLLARQPIHNEEIVLPSDALGEEADADEGGLPGWLVWIGLLILVNVLSYIFDWPFWVY